MVEIQEANHWVFQLANVFLAFSYLSANIIMLRIMLLGAGVCFTLWGWFVLDVSLDTVIWNAVFTFINLAQLARLVYMLRPVEFDNEHLDLVYSSLFNHSMSRRDFKTLCEAGFLRELKAGSTYCDEGSTAHYLSILISGRFGVSKRGVSLNVVDPVAFIDSPQWVARHTPQGDLIGVTIYALEDSVYLMWPRENLDRLMDSPEQSFKHALDAVIGKDIAVKLAAMNEIAVGEPSGRVTPAGAYNMRGILRQVTSTDLNVAHKPGVVRFQPEDSLKNSAHMQDVLQQAEHRLAQRVKAALPSASHGVVGLGTGTPPQPGVFASLSMQQQMQRLEAIPAALLRLYVDVTNDVREVQEQIRSTMDNQLQSLHGQMARELTSVANMLDSKARADGAEHKNNDISISPAAGSGVFRRPEQHGSDVDADNGKDDEKASIALVRMSSTPLNEVHHVYQADEQHDSVELGNRARNIT